MTQNDVIMQHLLIEIKNYLDAVIPSFECSGSDEFRTIDDVRKWGKMPDFYAELERQIHRHSIAMMNVPYIAEFEYIDIFGNVTSPNTPGAATRIKRE